MEKQDIMVILTANGGEHVAVMRDESYAYVALGYNSEDKFEEVFECTLSEDDDIREPNMYESAMGNTLREKNQDFINEIEDSLSLPVCGDDELYVREANKKIKIPILPYLYSQSIAIRDEFPVLHDCDVNRLRSTLRDSTLNLLMVVRNGRKTPYILSDEYVEEMNRQAYRLGESTNTNLLRILGKKSSNGILVASCCDEEAYSLLWSWQAESRALRFVMLQGAKVLVYFGEKLFPEEDNVNVAKSKYSSHFAGDTDRERNNSVIAARNLLYRFLAMEVEADEHVQSRFDSSTEETYDCVRDAIKAKDPNFVHTDYIIRDSTWYNTIWVDDEVFVRTYKSHRFKRDARSNALVLVPVDVRAHTRNGYHRLAKIIKSFRDNEKS